MREQAEYNYDVFISYNQADKEWVQDWLLPQLEAAGLRVCIDFRDFEPGLASLVNIENAVERSRKTLIVLTPEWVASQWTTFESLLIQTNDPAGRSARLIPLMVKWCEPPKRIAILTYVDFTQASEGEFQLRRLLAAIRSEPATKAKPGLGQWRSLERLLGESREISDLLRKALTDGRISQSLARALDKAVHCSEVHSGTFLGTPHLLLGLASAGGPIMCAFLQEIGLELSDLEEKVMHLIYLQPHKGDHLKGHSLKPTTSCLSALELMIAMSQEFNTLQTSEEHLILAMLDSGSSLFSLLQKTADIDFSHLRALAEERCNTPISTPYVDPGNEDSHPYSELKPSNGEIP